MRHKGDTKQVPCPGPKILDAIVQNLVVRATGICAPLCYGNVKINSKTTNSQVSCLISNEQLKISDTINYQLWMTLESSIAKQIYDLSLHKNK
jgi:hypothetical protein